MNKKALELMEYEKIKEVIKGYTLSELGREMVEKLEPYIDINLIERYLKETTEARAVVDITSSVPIHSLTGIKNIMGKVTKGIVFNPEDLEGIAGLLLEGKRLKRFMKDKEHVAPSISNYAFSIHELDELGQEIGRCIKSGRVHDDASTQLSKTRKKISITESRIKSKLEGILSSPKYKNIMQESLVSVRDGRYVIPVKSESRKNIEGAVMGSSGSGSTVFIEPLEVKKLHDELNLLNIEEDNEVYRILSTLTVLVEASAREIAINIETMAYYDFLFAKAKYSKAIEGRSVKLNNDNYIDIKEGKHPLVGASAVPLDFSIGKDYRSLVITGPNTGGKTVALKTIGLLTMMVQSGLHVSVGVGSCFAVFIDILADIGDGQSIEQSLSTFSSHIKNIINILECADSKTLVIFDEIGAGTDPGEGMGIAAAVLEKIHEKGAVMIATTHYSEIKNFAKEHEGFKNGRMGFDIATLKPLYKLTIGEAGESNALLIALRLGMDKKLIEKAHQITYKESKEYADYEESELIISTDRKDYEEHMQQIEKRKQIEKARNIGIKQSQKPKFNIGDCVYISDMERTGIVCELENSKGELGVMVMKKKFKINHKKLSLYVAGKELYPDDYDFDIVLESKENRRNKKLMDKGNVENIEVEIRKGTRSID